tara:strand:+ start:731 stop:889 length:159 start_codon:yes stop_codon:yes gene_type:complete
LSINGLLFYSEGDCTAFDFDLMNLKSILENIIEAAKIRAVAHHGASVEVANK